MGLLNISRKKDLHKSIKITREDLRPDGVSKYLVYYASLKTVVLKNKTLSIAVIRIEDVINMLFRNIVFKSTHYIFDNLKRTFSFGFYYIRGLFFLFFIDACLTDDEPLWEPIE